MPPSRPRKAQPTWSDIKAKLADVDRHGLVSLIADLYAASNDNRTLLHTRFALHGDPLELYKDTIARWVYPDVFERQGVSVAKAKKAISDYRKAASNPHGLIELMTFYCERAAGFAADMGMEDEGYFNALVRMFEQAVKNIAGLDPSARTPFRERLDKVRERCGAFGYGAGDAINDVWARSTAPQAGKGT
jgi:hypothetical protein